MKYIDLLNTFEQYFQSKEAHVALLGSAIGENFNFH